MRLNEFSQEVDEVRMDPTSFAQAVEQGHTAGVLVGFEFEVCIPEATIKGTAANAEPSEKAPKTVDEVDEVFADSDYWEVNIGATRSPEWFDRIFKFKKPYRGFNTAEEAYPAYTESILPRIIELYNKLTPKQRKKYSDMAVDRIRENNRSFSFDSKKLSDQLEFAKMFGYLLYIKNNNNELETLGSQLRQIAGNSKVWSGFLQWLTGNNNIGYEFSKQFNFDPTVVWDTLQLDDYSYDDEDYDDEGDNYQEGARVLQPALASTMGSKVNVFQNYHQAKKNLTDWYIEPDGSLDPDEEADSTAEIVSPPLPALDAMSALNKFYALASKLNLYTNDSTGLHINVSIPQKLDVLKLAVFLGDEYVLRYFGRENNRYANSVFKSLSGITNPSTDVDVKKTKKDVFGRPAQTTKIDVKALNAIANSVSGAHTASISYNGKYISFRHAGGNYLADLKGVTNVVGRFVRAMIIASDPTAYVQEYKTKLAKLAQGSQKETPADSNALVNYLRTKGAPVLTISVMSFKGRKPETVIKNYLSDNPAGLVGGINIKEIASGAAVKQELTAKASRTIIKNQIQRVDSLDRFKTYQVSPMIGAALARISQVAPSDGLETVENKDWDDIGYCVVTKTLMPPTDPVVQSLIKDVLRTLYKNKK